MATELANPRSERSILVEVRELSKRYERGPLWRRVPVDAVREVSFEIEVGKTLAVVGASGSGKSTLARCMARLEKPDSGHIWFSGTEITNLPSSALLPFRSSIQMIFQDAATAMNPRFSAAEVLEEPLRIQGRSHAERRHVAEQCMKEVRLSVDWLGRPVRDFSGGQQQRLAIARALTLRPKFLVLDEALTGLDLSTQAQIANLLLDLQASYGLTYLLISHDLCLVARMADMIAVMCKGSIIEMGTVHRVITGPQQPETRKLLQSAGFRSQPRAFGAGTQ